MARRTRWGGEEEIAAVYRALVDAAIVAPLELGGQDELAWLDCDLASFAENRLGDATDPRRLDEPRRELWRTRATSEAVWLPSQRDFERDFWLLDGGRRVGTIALATSLLGGTRVRVSSLYVFPPERGRSLARRALEGVRDALAARDLDLRLSTSWTWQRPLRLYLRMGMWVRMWKRDLDLSWDARTPPPIVEIGSQHASLSILHEGSRVRIAGARRDGARLVLDENVATDDKRLRGLTWDAPSTLALSLALEGWPLVRSKEHWDKSYWADAGAPESLAYKIALWEAWDKKHGWRVETPKIPGLEYPTWDELEARWAAQEAARVTKE